MATPTIEWIRQNNLFNTTVDDATIPVCSVIDNSGNVYVAYQTVGTVSGKTKLGTTDSDIIIFKMNSAGVVQWVLQDSNMNTTMNEQVPSMAVDASGNLYIAYGTQGTVSGQSRTATNPTFTDTVVAKIDTNGVIQWLRQNSALNNASGGANPKIALDPFGNIYITNFITGSASGQSGSGQRDILVIRMDTSGNVIWLKQSNLINTNLDEFSQSVCCDTSGFVYIGYVTAGTVSGQSKTSSQRDCAIAKMDSSGSVLWVRQNNILNAATSNSIGSVFIQADPFGNIYGSYTVPGGTASGQSLIGESDIVIFKMSSAGDVQWIRQTNRFNTPQSELSSNYSLSTDLSGYVYVAYTTSGTMSGQSSSGLADMVITKMSPAGDVVWVLQDQTLNTSTNEGVPSISVSASGDIYVCYPSNGSVSGQTNISNTRDIVVFKMTPSGSVDWIRQNNTFNTIGEDTNSSITTDVFGNTYVAYYSTGTFPGQNKPVGTTNLYDIILCKMNSVGVTEWVRQQPTFNTNRDEFEPKLTSDLSGNVYMTYYTNGTTSGQNKTSPTNIFDIAVCKFDASGNTVWVRQNSIMNTTALNLYSSIACDSAGNVYVTYQTFGTVSGGTYIDTTAGYDIVVFKMNSAGVVQWIKENNRISTTRDDTVPSVAVDSTGNVYITYTTEGTSSGQSTLGSKDIVVTKLDTNGNTQWVRQNIQMNDGRDQYFSTITTDIAGNIYITYQSISTTPPNLPYIVIIKMDTLGNILWRQNNEVNNSGTGGIPAVISDASGSVYIAYEIFGTSSGQTSTGELDIVVRKLDASTGNTVWVRQNSSMNTSSGDSLPRLSIDISGNIFVTYYTTGTAQGQSNTTLRDIVVAKLRQVTPITNSFPVASSPNYLIVSPTLLFTQATIEALQAVSDLPAQLLASWLPEGGLPAGSLLRDLKKTVVVTRNKLHTHKFRLVQLIDGPATEGVGGSASDVESFRCGYICTWTASGIPFNPIA